MTDALKSCGWQTVASRKKRCTHIEEGVRRDTHVKEGEKRDTHVEEGEKRDIHT